MEVSKTESNEFWFLDLENENIKLKRFLKRKNKHLYFIDDTPKKFFILSNRKNQKNFALYETDILKKSEIYWRKIVSHKNNELIENFLCFKDFIILEIRKNGLSQLVQIDRRSNKKQYIEFEDEAYSINLSNNNNYKNKFFYFDYSSLKTPSSVFSQDLYTKKEK